MLDSKIDKILNAYPNIYTYFYKNEYLFAPIKLLVISIIVHQRKKNTSV